MNLCVHRARLGGDTTLVANQLLCSFWPRFISFISLPSCFAEAKGQVWTNFLSMSDHRVQDAWGLQDEGLLCTCIRDVGELPSYWHCSCQPPIFLIRCFFSPRCFILLARQNVLVARQKRQTLSALRWEVRVRIAERNIWMSVHVSAPIRSCDLGLFDASWHGTWYIDIISVPNTCFSAFLFLYLTCASLSLYPSFSISNRKKFFPIFPFSSLFSCQLACFQNTQNMKVPMSQFEILCAGTITHSTFVDKRG